MQLSSFSSRRLTISAYLSRHWMMDKLKLNGTLFRGTTVLSDYRRTVFQERESTLNKMHYSAPTPFFGAVGICATLKRYALCRFFSSTDYERRHTPWRRPLSLFGYRSRDCHSEIRYQYACTNKECRRRRSTSVHCRYLLSSYNSSTPVELDASTDRLSTSDKAKAGIGANEHFAQQCWNLYSHCTWVLPNSNVTFQIRAYIWIP